MVIYAAQPNRFYPYFFNKLFNCNPGKYRPRGKTIDFYYKETPDEWYYMALSATYQSLNSKCEFHKSFDDALRNKTLMHHENGKNYIVFDEQFRSETDMVLGILNTERIYKQQDDFIISTIIHPVDRAYEMYFFMKALGCGVALPRLYKEVVQYYGKQLNLLSSNDEDNHIVDLKEYIDAYIEAKGVFVIDEKVETDENCYRQTNIINGNNDFVGFMSDPVSMMRTTNYLNDKFNANIELSELFTFYNKIQAFCSAHTYRRKDLEKLLEHDIDNFYGLRKQYMGF